MTCGRPGIFWIASYPKSGNTWIRCLIASLLAGGAAPDLNHLGDVVPYPVARAWIELVLDQETSELSRQEMLAVRGDFHHDLAAKGCRHAKVHDRYDPLLFPDQASAGIVLVVRDPRDVAPSLAAQMALGLDQSIARMGEPGAILDRMGRGHNYLVEQHLGDWSGHVLSWQEQTALPLLLLRYEDLLREPVAQTARLAEFLGLPADGATLERAVGACLFDRLRQAEAAGGFAEGGQHAARFFRQGQSGGWRRVLSLAQIERLEADHGAVMARLGYDTGRRST